MGIKLLNRPLLSIAIIETSLKYLLYINLKGRPKVFALCKGGIGWSDCHQ